MGYSPTEYAEFTEPPAEMSSHGFHRFTQMVKVRCVPTECTEFTEFGSVGMAGMPYPPTSVRICAICGRLFSARSFRVFRVFRAFCGNIFSPTDFLLRRVWHLAIPTPPAMGYSPTEYAEFTEPPTEMSSHGFHRFTQMLRVRCSPTEFTEFTELGNVGMAGMPYPPTSVNIRVISGRFFSARGSVSSVLICGRFFSAKRFRAFCGNLFPPTEFTESTEFGSVGMAGMPYPPNLCASVPSVGGSSLPEVLCIRCIPWELLHRLFGWCS